MAQHENKQQDEDGLIPTLENSHAYYDSAKISDVKIGVVKSFTDSISKFKLRLAILWAAVKYLFTGEGVWMLGPIQLKVGEPGITAETWIKKNEVMPWQHWGVTFTGDKPACGYTDGVLVSEPKV